MAYHEAGHAVACARLGVRIAYATIVPGPDYAGKVVRETVFGADLVAPFCQADNAGKYGLNALIAFAGPAAQRRSHPRSPIAHGAHFDLAAADLTAEVLFDAVTSRRSFLRKAAKAARELVDRHWLAVDHVARELTRAGSLSGFAIAEIADEADEEWRQVSGYRPAQTTFAYARERALAAQGLPALRRAHLAAATLRATLAGAGDVEAAVLADLTARGYAAEAVAAEWTRAKEAHAT